MVSLPTEGFSPQSIAIKCDLCSGIIPISSQSANRPEIHSCIQCLKRRFLQLSRLKGCTSLGKDDANSHLQNFQSEKGHLSELSERQVEDSSKPWLYTSPRDSNSSSSISSRMIEPSPTAVDELKFDADEQTFCETTPWRLISRWKCQALRRANARHQIAPEVEDTGLSTAWAGRSTLRTEQCNLVRRPTDRKEQELLKKCTWLWKQGAARRAHMAER